MYIRKIKKKSPHNGKDYFYLHLVENIRTEHGPRQKLILNLGAIDIDPSQYQALAQRIEERLSGTLSFWEYDSIIENYADEAARKIFRKQSRKLPETAGQPGNPEKPPDEKDDNHKIEADQCRSIGPEYVCHSIWRELMLDNFFLRQGLPQTILPILETTVIGRLCDPGSELHTFNWAHNRSAILELLDNPQHTSLGSFYRSTDRLLELQTQLERHLVEKETKLFSLTDKYIFFDLTNSYFEGKCADNPKAQFGRSKEKRSDCRLVALGLAVDERGFAKGSRFFNGNRSEPTTLTEMVDVLEKSIGFPAEKRTVIMDAGLATEGNIAAVKERGYSYIVVHRGGAPAGIDYEDLRTIRGQKGSDIHIEVKRFECEGEAYVLCRSEQKRKKEAAMRSRIELLFTQRLEHLKAGLTKTGKQLKRYAKVLETIGRIKEKYPAIAKLYDIEVQPEAGNLALNTNLRAIDLKWQRKENHVQALREEGCYFLRTDRLDLQDEEIWELYIMLRRIEYSFLCMKSHLGLRPNFHQLENRVDAHMFVSVLAYHILQIVEQRLSDQDDYRKWETVKQVLSTHQRLTVSLPNASGGIRKIRLNTTPEPGQRQIYQKLGLSTEPLGRCVWTTKCSEEKTVNTTDSP